MYCPGQILSGLHELGSSQGAISALISSLITDHWSKPPDTMHSPAMSLLLHGRLIPSRRKSAWKNDTFSELSLVFPETCILSPSEKPPIYLQGGSCAKLTVARGWRPLSVSPLQLPLTPVGPAHWGGGLSWREVHSRGKRGKLINLSSKWRSASCFT